MMLHFSREIRSFFKKILHAPNFAPNFYIALAQLNNLMLYTVRSCALLGVSLIFDELFKEILFNSHSPTNYSIVVMSCR